LTEIYVAKGTHDVDDEFCNGEIFAKSKTTWQKCFGGKTLDVRGIGS
jgi:hypothetical protein